VREGRKNEIIFTRPWPRITFSFGNVFAGASVRDGERDESQIAERRTCPTRTRVALAYMLFAQGNRHVSAEMLFEEPNRAKVSVALATVYNTLREFTKVGFLRQVAVDSSKSYFDTNNTEHQHYYLEDRHELMDIPPTDVAVGRIPVPPEGYEIARVDVVVRLRRKTINSSPTS
jgi:Fur family iron response transcriptional regulator